MTVATLDNDSVLAVARILGVQTLPVVVDVGNRHDTIAAWTAANDDAMARLRVDGVLDEEGEVDEVVAAAMYTLAQPERELAVRIWTETGVRRVCLVRRGFQHAVADRDGEVIDIRTVWADEGGEALARPLLAALPKCAPADLPSFSAPSAELHEKLGHGEYGQALYELGVAERDAVEYGLALSSCTARAEIVAYSYDDGITTQSSGAIAIYDTDRGRIVASPGVSPDRQVWSTFAPGSDHRIVQAVSALVESLPGGRWMP